MEYLSVELDNFDAVPVVNTGSVGGLFDHFTDNLVLQSLPAFAMFSKTVNELLGLYSPMGDVPLQIASFVHYGGKNLLYTLVHALMDDNVLQAVNINTGYIETLATAVDSSCHFLRVNPHFTSVPPLRLYTYFVSMVMTTITMHPTGKCSNLLRLVTGYSRNVDIQSYFKDLSLHFLFGGGFWPMASSSLVSNSSASMSVPVYCSVPFVSQVISKLDIFFFLPRLFHVVNERDKHVLVRLMNMHPRGCPSGTFVCQHDGCSKNNNGFFTLRVFFSGEDNDPYDSLLMEELAAGTVTVVNNTGRQPYVEETSRRQVSVSTPEYILPNIQCKEVRRVTAYLRTSSLLAPHNIICDNVVTAPGEMNLRHHLGQFVSVLQTFPGGHERMVLSLAIALHLVNPLAIQVIVARDVDMYLNTIYKYNHGKYITVMRSVNDLHLFSGNGCVFLLSTSMFTSEFTELVRGFHTLVVRTLIIDYLTPAQQHLMLNERIFKHEQLVIAQPKQRLQQKKKRIEVFALESTTHNVQDIIAECKHNYVSHADILHSILSSIDIEGDRNMSVQQRADLKQVLGTFTGEVFPVVVQGAKRPRSCDFHNDQDTCKRPRLRYEVPSISVQSEKMTAFKEYVMPSILSQTRLHFNVLIVVSDDSVAAYQQECQRMGLTTALFDYDTENISRNRKIIVRSLKNDKLQVLFIPAMASWNHTYKMENVVIVDACGAKDNIASGAAELGRRRCIVLSEKNSYTQWRLSKNNGLKVDDKSIHSCLHYLSCK